MSTQSPHPPTPKASRNNNNNNNNNNRRPPKKNTTPHAQKVALLSTPPSSPPRNMSPAGVMTDSSNNLHSKRKPPRSGKKPNNGNRVSPAPNNGHRQTSSHANVNTPQVKDSAAYAGPTFHASPAPSALPIPSFISKSFPESDLAPTHETESEPELETTPSKPRARPQLVEEDSKPTPLDFLFKAAVQARQSNPISSPETTTRVRSPQTDPKPKPHHSRSEGPPGGMFAFEMENSEHTRASYIGPSFATSYQDRMNALRSSSSPSQSPDFGEDQRRMKTEQLKHLLLNPRPQKPPSSVSPAHDHSVNYGERHNINACVPHYATPMRTTSGPPVTLSHGFSSVEQQQQLPMPNHSVRSPFPYPQSNGSQQLRNTNSPLRREVPSNAYHSGHSTASPYGNHYMANHYMANTPAPAPLTGYDSPQPQYASAAFNMPTNSPSPSKPVDTKKMEDDIRRILKLDAAPGIQSSFA
ncbi:uncharacterized protein N7459_003865 [Penicillium hispanicum]|uniref:uncharacterized protein n=1 Tax=Penicillium hispanicum TaxID=1080232 RepID=UPI002541FE14|nr:uncharacterized protein N7459_003865 [Penicillium hispanicum]KAJ5584065.1 hypothetical protein N7459_003865 [Penicillium hispanicum]